MIELLEFINVEKKSRTAKDKWFLLN